jgi:hypothetical protein
MSSFCYIFAEMLAALTDLSFTSLKKFCCAQLWVAIGAQR